MPYAQIFGSYCGSIQPLQTLNLTSVKSAMCVLNAFTLRISHESICRRLSTRLIGLWAVEMFRRRAFSEGLFSSVIGIRQKLNNGKKLEKYEQEFYRNHRNMIDLKRKLSAEEQRAENEDKEFLKQLTGGE